MGYQQSEVIFLLDLNSHSQLSEWEAGRLRPNLENLLRLSIIYRTLPDELYYDLRQELVKDIEEREKLLQANGGGGPGWQ